MDDLLLTESTRMNPIAREVSALRITNIYKKGLSCMHSHITHRRYTNIQKYFQLIRLEKRLSHQHKLISYICIEFNAF